MDEEPDRSSLLGIIGGLMVSENMGDVHDELNLLCDLVGIPRPKGNYLTGWIDADYRSVGLEPEERSEEGEK